ncbi:unnamed protein product [Soboliphyme baturini]|uniref:Mitochondrial import receptor subunit TOM70 n=1 Tax=Soboliphyme baturini TaxID=241478 RepID=A0A183IHX7_9BILA|nr:unnamed protein product [Soboliphyme baturini]
MCPTLVPVSVKDELIGQNWWLSHRYQICGIVALLGISGAATYCAVRYFKKDRKPGEASIDLDRLNSTSLKERGNKSFKKGDYAEALDYFTAAIQKCPSDRPMELATFYQNRAATYEKLDELEKVLDDCNSAISLNKRYVKALLRRGKANKALGRLEDALYGKLLGLGLKTDMRESFVCIKLPKFAIQCRVRISRNLLQNVHSVPIVINYPVEAPKDMNAFRMTDQLMNECAAVKAKELMSTRNPEELPLSDSFVESYLSAYVSDPVTTSIDEVKQRLQHESDLAACGYFKALKCLEDKKYSEVISACTCEITAEGEFLHLALLLRATFYILYSCVAKATADIDSLLKLLENEPPDALQTKKMKSNAYVKRASLYMQQVEKDLAMTDFSRAEEADPDNSDVYLHRGQFCILIGDFDGAVRDFAHSVKLCPDFPLASIQENYARYRIAVQKNDDEGAKEALKDFRQTVERFPNCSEGCMLFGQV